MADRIEENNLYDNDTLNQSQTIYARYSNPSIEITGFASKSGDSDYYRYFLFDSNSTRSKFSISLTYSDYSRYQQPFNPQKPVLVRDIFDYAAVILSKNKSIDFISNSQPTSSIFVDSDGVFSKDPIIFYTEKSIFEFYISVQGAAGFEGDTKLPQQYYKINIKKLNGPVGELLTNGEIGFSKTITADYSKVSDLDGIKIGSEKIEWFRGQNLISTGKDLILSNNLAFESIYYKFSYIDSQGDNEYVISNAVKPEVIIDPLKITIAQNNQSIILSNDFNYAASKIFIFNGETLISEVDNISDFKISKSYVGSELNLIVAASDGKFYKSTTLKISNINLPALRNGTPLLDVVEADKEGIYSTYFDNRTIVDDDGMSFTTGSFTLYIDGESSQQLIARENTYARDYGIRPLKWLQTSFNFQDAHVGKNYEVIFSFVDNLGNSEKVVLNKGKVLNLNDKPTGLLSITDIASQGQTLKLTNSLADDDGLGKFSYQWQSNGISIIGATGSSYTLKQAEVGKVITVVASYTDLQGTAESVASGPTASVANVNDAPTGSVTITGTATQGQVLTASNNLADADGLGTISYQWLADGTNISGATNATFTLTQAQVGKAISVKASYTDLLGTTEIVSSTATSIVANVNDLPTGSVTLTGTATQGQVLTAGNTLADADGLGTISYQWLADGTNISGATSTTLTLAQAQVGKAISVKASYTDQLGTAESVTSTATASVTNSGTGTSTSAKFWKDNTKAPTDTKKADAVNLTDAIAILKMIVGLNVNSNNTPLSPYQAIAADFDQSGDVGLTDAIGVLKMVVGLSAPTPTWKYYDDTKLASTYTSVQSLSPKAWTTTSVISDTGTVDRSVKLIGVLMGDVDGSWTGV